MPGTVEEPLFTTIAINKLHPTFGAEVFGVDFPRPSAEQFREILLALAVYGFCVFRNTGLDDATHVEFSRRFGELDDVRPYVTPGKTPRCGLYELFDAGNIDENGGVIDPESPRAHYNKGNALFHVDSSFNPRRASYSLLRAFELPPPGNGGNTEFADSRTAFDELPQSLKAELLEQDYVAAHSLWHSRKTASPEFFKDLDPTSTKMHMHRIAQVHEPSGRMNLYVAAHAHHVEHVDAHKSADLLSTLLSHIAQKKYVVSVPWENVSDLVIWDNTCVLHRATGGAFEGKYRRDLRRTTVHDASTSAWGLNEQVDSRVGFKHNS